MKRLVFVVAAALPAWFVACSSDDSSAPGLAGEGGAGGVSASASASTGRHASSSSTGHVGSGGGEEAGGGSLGAGGDGGGIVDGGSDGASFDCDVLGEPGYCLETSDCSATPMHASWPGFCPGAADIQCCIPDTTLLCDSSATPMPSPNDGLTTEAPGTGGCPDGMIRVTTFCVDRFEASLVRADDGSAWSPYYNPGATPMIAVSVEGAVPQAYIDQIEADDACTNAGKRLCADAEWLRACQGPSGDTYPYGDTREPGVCNDGRSVHPAEEYYGSTDPSVFSMLDDACINQLPESLDPSGENAGCVTAEGAFDMMGNVHEWTADPNGTFRGGYYVDTTLNGNGCLYATTAHDTSYWDYSTGFRCCAD